MPTPVSRLLRACLFAAAAVLLAPHSASAQCTEEPCEPWDVTPPAITISPGSGTYPAGSLGVTINWSDGYALNHNSRVITYGGSNVTSSFTYTSSNGGAAQSSGTVTVGMGSKALTAYICDMASYPNCTTVGVTYTGPAPAVRVSRTRDSVSVAGSAPAAVRFRVVNTGTATTTYSLSAVCPSGSTACTASPDTARLAPGDSAWVDAGFTAPASGSGWVRLTAAAGSVSRSDSTFVTALPAPDLGYPGDAESLMRMERGHCLTVAMGPASASECGALRVVHALPSVRALNKQRTPVLIYNHDLARPIPVVAQHLAPPAGPTPDTIRAVLTVNGVHYPGKWVGWPSTQTRRIAVAFPAWGAGGVGNRVIPYHWQVTAEWNGQGSTVLVSENRRMVVVDRSGSPFGAGWWLAGLEQIKHLDGDTLKLWVGGDGSARLYRRPGSTGPWVADGFDRPETIEQTTNGNEIEYFRTLPGGARVYFNQAGEHVRTVNTLGHATTFAWTGTSTTSRRLEHVILPATGANQTPLRYTFEYNNNATTAIPRLSKVISPGPVDFRYTQVMTDTRARIDSIIDPESEPVTFGYVGTTAVMNRRTDRRQAAQTFGYAAGRLHSSLVRPQPDSGIGKIMYDVRGRGQAGMASVRVDSLWAIWDGGRTEVCDCIWWRLNRWGAPVEMRDMYGNVTTYDRGDSRWPANVTRIRAPNGSETTASYDARGNPVSTTAWYPYGTALNPHGDGRHATTTYEWHDTLYAPTRVVAPEGEETRIGYDVHGRREWEQTGPSTTRRVTYQYNALTHASAPGLLERVVYPDLSADRLEYNARGNLSATVSPMGARSEFESDRLGRVTVQRVAIDTVAGLIRFQGDSTFYDGRDRPWRVASFAPSLLGEGLQQVVVVNEYDREGALLSLSRSSVPDTLGIGTITTRWRYDLVGRRILEIAPDHTPADSLDNPRDSTVYDRAGNVREVHTRRYADNGQRVVVRMEYDPLNRLTHRIIPEVVYDSIDDGLALRGFIYPHEDDRIDAIWSRKTALPYPWYPNSPGWKYRIPGDTVRFFYDGMGNLERADNRDAWIRRSYYRGGALLGETLKIRTVDDLSAGGDSTSHVYTLEHLYDRNGRRTALIHPANIAPGPASSQQDRTRYGYDRVTGALSTVTDPLGNLFTYQYNTMGQLQGLVMPGGLSDEYEYDLDGRLTRHRTRNAYTTGANRYTDALLRDEQFRYDTRGKMIFSGNAAGAGDTTKVRYTGLGHMRADTVLSKGAPYGRTIPASTATQQVIADALGNRQGMRGTSTFELPWRKNFSVNMEFPVYQAGTGRLLGTDDGHGTDFLTYDGGGNVIFSKTVQQGSYSAAAGLRDHAYFYGGDGMLRAAETRIVHDRRTDMSDYRRAFEEYRYDALGRRIWVRARRECHQAFSGYCELGWVRRTVWDGDRELYEIQAPSSGEIPYDDVRREYDTTLVNMGLRDGKPGDGNEIDPNPFYGRVAYTYGLGIDQPLSVVRMGYANMRDTLGNPGYVVVAPFAIVPLWNTRGQAGLGAFADGTWQKCVGTSCVKIVWPERWPGYARPQMFRDFWHGTLLQDKQDGSGLNYRRNRYYDPATGRFTQEDPIGLAGGLNVYGFGAGDPVNYGDPYGLYIIVQGSREYRQRVLRALRYVGGRSETFRNIVNQFATSRSVHIRVGADILANDPGCGGPGCHRSIPFKGISLVQVRDDIDGDAAFADVLAHEILHAAGAQSRRLPTNVPPQCAARLSSTAHACTDVWDQQIKEEIEDWHQRVRELRALESGKQ